MERKMKMEMSIDPHKACDRMIELFGDMLKLYSKEENEWVVVATASFLAGHLINERWEDGEKNDHIRKARDILEDSANGGFDYSDFLATIRRADENV